MRLGRASLDDRGASLAQYGILLALIAVVVIASLDKTAAAIIALLNVDMRAAAGMAPPPDTGDAAPSSGAPAQPPGEAAAAPRTRAGDAGNRESEEEKTPPVSNPSTGSTASNGSSGTAGSAGAEVMAGSRACELPIVAPTPF
jgi:Flp pilus assembly pilin Flp